MALATQNQPAVVGAVLLKGGEDGQLMDNFDLWVVTNKTEALLEADDDCTVFGDTIEDIYLRIRERYPNDVQASRITDYNERHIRYRVWNERRRRYETDSRGFYDGRAWMVLPYPLADHPESRTELRVLCTDSGIILVRKDEFNSLGTDDEYRKDGFTIGTYGNGEYIKLRWNVKNASLQDWKKRVAGVEKLIKGELPGTVMYDLGEAVSFKAWDDDTPFGCILNASHRSFSAQFVPRRRHNNWRYRQENNSSNYSPRDIMAHVKLAKILKPDGFVKPWRDPAHRELGKNMSSAIERALPYIHGMLEREDANIKALAHFIIAEARHLKKKLPKKIVVPPKPRFKKGMPCLPSPRKSNAIALPSVPQEESTSSELQEAASAA